MTSISTLYNCSVPFESFICYQNCLEGASSKSDVISLLSVVGNVVLQFPVCSLDTGNSAFFIKSALEYLTCSSHSHISFYFYGPIDECALSGCLDLLNSGVYMIVLDDTATLHCICENDQFSSILSHGRVRFKLNLDSVDHLKEEIKDIQINLSSYSFLHVIIDCSNIVEQLDGMDLFLSQMSTYKDRITLLDPVSNSDGLSSILSMEYDIILSKTIYSGSISIPEIITSRLKTDRDDKLFPTVVTDRSGVALGLVYSSTESIEQSLRNRKGVYHSRKRGIWEKGLTSGASQHLFKVELDCDCDCLRFVVEQEGTGFCHLSKRSCWSHDSGIGNLFRTMKHRVNNPIENSYTQKLLKNDVLLKSKLLEEMYEFLDATDVGRIAEEAADVLYFVSVLCSREGISLPQIEAILNQRSLRVTRRAGNSKSHIDSLLHEHFKKS